MFPRDLARPLARVAIEPKWASYRPLRPLLPLIEPDRACKKQSSLQDASSRDLILQVALLKLCYRGKQAEAD